MSRTYPRNAWYALATSASVGREPLGTRALEQPVVLFRALDGRAVALADRDAHAPYPLSLGHLDGDTIVSGYSGFVYDASGACVKVPTQAQVPYGAAVDCFVVREEGGLVWVWLGEASLAAMRAPIAVPWLEDPAWETFGGDWETRANLLMLHENFADITHVAVVDPVISPPALSSGEAPALEIELTETTVSFSRDWPASPMAPWQASMVGVAETDVFPQHEEGAFLTPGLWADRWDFVLPDGTQSFRFTHAVTPVDDRTTRHFWRVSRNFALGDEVTARFRPIFEAYYLRVREILETMQAVVDRDGAGQNVYVAADRAAVQVRRIMRRLVADEG